MEPVAYRLSNGGTFPSRRAKPTRRRDLLLLETGFDEDVPRTLKEKTSKSKTSLKHPDDIYTESKVEFRTDYLKQTPKKSSKFSALMAGETVPNIRDLRSASYTRWPPISWEKSWNITLKLKSAQINTFSSEFSSTGTDIDSCVSASVSTNSLTCWSGEIFMCTLPDYDIDQYNDGYGNDYKKDKQNSKMKSSACSNKLKNPPLHNNRKLYLLRSLLSARQVSSILNLVKRYQQRQASLTSDSLKNSARCLVAVEDGEPQLYNDEDISNEEKVIVPRKDNEDLTTILLPILEQRILPAVREIYNSPNVVIADALVRWYDAGNGDKNNGNIDNNASSSFEALAPHYDVSSFATVIVPLNPLECEGGLYVQYGAGVDTRRYINHQDHGFIGEEDKERIPSSFVNDLGNGDHSSHSCSTYADNGSSKPDSGKVAGDAIFHRFDVMHGVHIQRGLRYSLVVWLAEDEKSRREKSTPWVKREAENGTSVHAAFLHGMNARFGIYGEKKNMKKAVQYWNWASDRGHPLSQYSLAMLLLKIQGEDQDPGVEWNGVNHSWEEVRKEMLQRAVILLKNSAEAGLDLSQFELGTFFKEGYHGVEKDWKLARKWYNAAAAQGYVQAIEVLTDLKRW